MKPRFLSLLLALLAFFVLAPTVLAQGRTGAICADGTTSGATGRGACSHHGGVAQWITSEPEATPTFTAVPTASPLPAATATPDTTTTITQPASNAPIASAIPISDTNATVSRDANLRAGPGTSYPLAGTVAAGQVLTLVEQNDDGSWYHLASGEWIAAFLVDTNTGKVSEQLTAPNTDAQAASVTSTGTLPTANQVGNLRAGPDTSYDIVGKVQPGQSLQIVGRSEASDWYQLSEGQWLAAFLVENPPSSLPVVASPAQPTPVANAPEPTPTQAAKSSSPSIVDIGQELKGNGWRFHVKEIHKRKAVYWGSDSYVAMGHFLVVIIDAVNEQSGTDYFGRNITPYLTDDPGNAYLQSTSGTLYATWQYEGLATIYSDVNPGNLVRIAMAFDLPDNLGNVMLSTALPGWVRLGDFAGMKSEDN